VSSRIPTYLSHSYRPEDRAVNLYFWKLFWDAGFAFTVAPRSGTFSISHLELMMRRSSCFVGLATHRPDVSNYLTSAYQVYEYGMAVLAQKPRLVFVEAGVAGRFFEQSRTIVFRRADISDEDDEPRAPTRWKYAMELLHEMSVSYTHQEDRTLGSVGVLLPRDGPYRAVVPAIRDLMRRAGYEVVDVDYDNIGNIFQLILDVDRHDFILLALDAGTAPPWLYPLLTGRFVPMIRLRRRDPSDQRALSTPDILLGHAIELVAGDELAILWSDPDELIYQLEREIERLKRPRVQFRSLAEGQGYFNSLGRTIEAAVFVSNAAAENDFAQRLSRLLDINNIPFFHYVYRNTIELGTPWTERLRTRLESSQLFVPLITRAYWESEVCRQEFNIAKELNSLGRLRIYPYFLEDIRDIGPEVNMQGRTLHGLPLDQQLSGIVRDIDQYLMSITADGA
jgi:hypothetical protein